MLTLNYRDSRPIYGQIKDGLRRMIVTGVLEPDERLPSVRSMAVDLAINPNTIQRAYAELEAEGFIYSVPGKGSFAAQHLKADPARQSELVRRLRELVAELRYLGLSDSEIISLMNEEVAQ
ncbi:MAG: GntR family transcriptional regulator [Oscillibacter sp.]|nr:GntR family transcriptional regulator [Oscillibacter sp.]